MWLIWCLAFVPNARRNWKHTDDGDQSKWPHDLICVSASHWLAVSALSDMIDTSHRVATEGYMCQMYNYKFHFCICNDWNDEFCIQTRLSLFLAADYIWINQVIVIVQQIILQPLTLQNVWAWTAWSAGEGGTAVQRFKPNILQAAIKETSLLSPSVQGEEKLNVMCVSAAPPPSQLSNFMLQFFLLN